MMDTTSGALRRLALPAAAATLLLTAAGCATTPHGGVVLPPLPVLSPTALTADAGDGRAYLRWNPQIEDARVAGWRVIRFNANARAKAEVLKEPATVVTNLENGTEYRFAVVGVLADGSLTPQSNPVTVTPRKTGQAKVDGVGGKLVVGKREIALIGPSVRITFPDGQVLVYDRFRPLDWQARDGEHLIAPEHFGNGLDIGRFDQRGLPAVIVPPDGLTKTELNVGDDRWTMMNPDATDNFSVRWQGFVRPRFTGTYTFHALADDGVRLYVDGKTIIDQWVHQPPTEHTGSIGLEAGRTYAIRMEYFEYNGGATARLLWSGAGQAKEVIPAECLFPPDSTGGTGAGLRGTYFQNVGLVSPVMTRIDPMVDFRWGMGGPFHETVAPRFYYQDAQFGQPHPFITDPLTLSLRNAQPRWYPPEVDRDRVTLHWLQPLMLMGYRAWTHALIWETWWPIERDIHGTTYHGLARMVEVEMPSCWKAGYQVMLNNGLGPGGSREGVVSYSTGFRTPGHEIVDFSGPANRTVSFGSSARPPRAGSLYHPNQSCLQASPLIFYDWDRPDARGSLLIAARSLYYHCANASATYAEQGVDGVWPGLAWDLAQSGKRTYVDTVEYLYAPAPKQPLPQRFVNARFWAYGNVSRRMGVQDRLAVVSTQRPHHEVKPRGGPAKFAEYWAKTAKDWGVDALDTAYDVWVSVPILVDESFRNDLDHPLNREVKEMNRIFREAGYGVGFWLRPEFLTTSLPSALSSRIPGAGEPGRVPYVQHPDRWALLEERGLPEIREHQDWIRKQIDGSWPARTPYDWVPMSLASGWHDRVIWPALNTAAKLGYTVALVDGGYGGLQGVDYNPMLAGRTELPLPMQPFWWRFWRTMEHVGIRPYGECTRGWKGGNVFFGGEGDQHYAWMFQMGWYREKPMTPRFLHQLHQLYNGTEFRAGDELLPVRRYAVEFHRKHPNPPDWIELVDLRQGDEIEVAVRHRDGPAAGLPDTGEVERATSVKVRPWTWGDAIWHYDDGTSVVYPAYDRVKWGTP